MKTENGWARWIWPGIKLAVGVPLIACAGLLPTWLLPMLLGPTPPEYVLTVRWYVGFTLTCIPLWLLVRHAVRAGGGRALALGLVCASIVPASSFALGAITQEVQPGENGMAGMLWVLLAAPLALAVIVSLVMGLIAIARTSGRSGAPVVALSGEPSDPSVAG